MFQNLVGEGGVFLTEDTGRSDGAGEHFTRRGTVVFQDEFFSVGLVDYSLSNSLSRRGHGGKPWSPNNTPVAAAHGHMATAH